MVALRLKFWSVDLGRKTVLKLDVVDRRGHVVVTRYRDRRLKRDLEPDNLARPYWCYILDNETYHARLNTVTRWLQTLA